MIPKDEIFKSNEDYIQGYLDWLDTRIKNIYEIKTKNNSGPLKGLIVSTEDIKDIVDSSLDRYITSYNILQDKSFLLLEEKVKNTIANGISLNLEKLCELFNLSIAEKLFILIAIAVDINPKYEKIFCYFNDNINRVRPTINFILDILGIQSFDRNILRESFFDKALFKSYILHYSFGRQDVPLFSNEIRIDDRIVNYILGIDEIDNDIKEAIEIIDNNTIVEIDEDKSIFDKLSMINSEKSSTLALFCIYGESGVGKKENIKLLCKKLNKTGIIVNLKLYISNTDDFKINILKTIREAILKDAILILDNYNEIVHIEDAKQRAAIENTLLDEIKKYNKNIVILSNERIKLINDRLQIIDIEIKKPSFTDSIDIWSYYNNKYNTDIENIKDCATKFSFTPKQIKNTVLAYKTKLLYKYNSDKEKLLYEACFEQVSHNLYKRATKVNLNYSWEQLVLPNEQKSLLLDACNQVENKYKVYDEWGFNKTVAYGRGVTIVCSGPPGTGKTMSAQVIANKLNLELFKIDLSQIVSKYVGETEKNLNEIFNEARISNAILFFDEADSLFGKRSEVKSSNDRYSNLETSYLLQKIEEYEGVSMLATNYLKNIDDAFIRRMKYIVVFPFPDIKTRKEIWKITIPDNAPVSKDIDFDFLAEAFELSGGNIKNILVYAAFLSTAENSKINMKYILKATKYEMQKIGKLVLAQDLKQYRHLIDE